MSDPAASPRSLRWPLLIVGLLLTHAIGMIIAVVVAVGDPSFAVVPDYYRKAVTWDVRREAQQRSDALGWRLTITPGSFTDVRGQRSIVCDLSDAVGRPVAADSLHLSYFHHAHAGAPSRVTLAGNGAGRFEGVIPMRWPGFWRIEATTGDGAFVQELDIEVRGRGATP